MNGAPLALGLAAFAALASAAQRGSAARASLPTGLRARWFSADGADDEDDGDEDDDSGERLDVAARALAKKVNIGILRDKELRLVVQKGSKVVGALFDATTPNYSFDVVVDPSLQGTGIGRWLVEQADGLARESEDSGYATKVQAVNPIIQAMLIRRGFTVTGRERGTTLLQRGVTEQE